MTDLIDLNFHEAKITSKRSSSSNNSFQHPQTTKVYSIDQVIQKFVNKIDKINIKSVEIYVFELDKTKVLFREIFYYYPVKIVGGLSLGNGMFSLRIQFLDQNGTKVSAKSLHHRTVISNFAFQVNSELQNYKLEFNPVSGQFSYVFNIKAQYFDRGSISELFEFALNSYFEECQGHFYVLHLIQYINRDQNLYIKTIEEDFVFLKQWIMERSQQNQAMLEENSFYKIFKQQNHRHQNYIQNISQVRPQLQIKMIEKYLCPIQDQLLMEQEQCSYRTRYIYKLFKKYYNESTIIPLFLTTKAKYQNILTIKPKQIKTFFEFLNGKCLIKQKQNDEYHKFQFINENSLNKSDSNLTSVKNSNSEEMDCDEKSEQSVNRDEVLRIWDKESGKCYCVKILALKSSAKNEKFLLQKLCKVESYLFINQYIILENQVMNNEIIMVNIHPKRIKLSDFMQKNSKIISLSSRIHICINLVQMGYTFNLKNKIQNYFPCISVKNIEISSKLYLSFKTLSFLSVFPLYELINTINTIVFGVSFNLFKRKKGLREKLIKGDEINNKFWGMSVFIYFLRYYLLSIYQEVVELIKINELKIDKKTSSYQNREMDQWIKDKFTRTCQELLVIFGHFQNISSRGYQEKYQFEEVNDSDEQKNDDQFDSSSST